MTLQIQRWLQGGCTQDNNRPPIQVTSRPANRGQVHTLHRRGQPRLQPALYPRALV
jgi:hypothetical protein